MVKVKLQAHVTSYFEPLNATVIRHIDPMCSVLNRQIIKTTNPMNKQKQKILM